MDNIFQELEEHGYQIFDKNYGFEIGTYIKPIYKKRYSI